MKNLSSCLVAALLLYGGASAHAGILDLRAEVHAGANMGRGVAGARIDDAFHEGAAGIGYGVVVGAEVLLIDGWIEHNQHHDGDGLAGTWTQFMLGLDAMFDMGEEKGEGDKYSSMFFELGMAVGFGVGTGQQVDPPLDNSEVTDKGFLGQVHLSLGWRLTKNTALGLTVPVQAAYLFKSGEGAANDEGTHYGSVQGAGLLTLRMDLPIK